MVGLSVPAMTEEAGSRVGRQGDQLGVGQQKNEHFMIGKKFDDG